MPFVKIFFFIFHTKEIGILTFLPHSFGYVRGLVSILPDLLRVVREFAVPEEQPSVLVMQEGMLEDLRSPGILQWVRSIEQL